METVLADGPLVLNRSEFVDLVADLGVEADAYAVGSDEGWNIHRN